MKTMLKMKKLAMSTLMLLVLMPLAAFAQEVTGPAMSELMSRLAADPTDLEAMALLVLGAIMGGQWGLLASVLLMVLVAGLRKWVPGKTALGQWFLTRTGTIVTTLAISLGGSFASMFVAHGTLSVPLVIKAVTVAITASGIWSIGKAIKEDMDEKKAAAAGVEAAEKPAPTGTLDK